jgi:AraC family transcriptional regulator, transcriptional activator FtrA
MKRLRNVMRIMGYALAFVAPIGALAATGLYSTMHLTMPKPRALDIPASGTGVPRTKTFDPAKPTVAIVLGNERTESTDFLIPYELFSAAGAYNVYAVAPARAMTSLAGGLEVIPDFSYAGLAALLGKPPAVVVVPAFPDVTSPENRPVLDWIKQQSTQGSFIFSICVGAEAFAATGLLDGRTATTHWGDIDRIEQAYPAAHWVRGVRYVDGGDYMTSAGITSGIDATLHYIAQHNGDVVARSVAQQMHYPSYAFVDNPEVPQESAGAGLTFVGLMNILFHPIHATAGVLVYDGVGELELASTYDTYAASYTARLLSVAQTRQVITSRHGLQVVPRWGFNDVPATDRLIVPGAAAHQLAGESISAWESNAHAAPVFYLHADEPDSFAFDGPLQDLARQENIPTAVLDAKRLEYRPGTLQAAGSRWPIWMTISPLLLGSASLAVTLFFSTNRRRRSAAGVRATPAQTHA